MKLNEIKKESIPSFKGGSDEQNAFELSKAAEVLGVAPSSLHPVLPEDFGGSEADYFAVESCLRGFKYGKVSEFRFKLDGRDTTGAYRELFLTDEPFEGAKVAMSLPNEDGEPPVYYVDKTVFKKMKREYAKKALSALVDDSEAGDEIRDRLK